MRLVKNRELGFLLPLALLACAHSSTVGEPGHPASPGRDSAIPESEAEPICSDSSRDAVVLRSSDTETRILRIGPSGKATYVRLAGANLSEAKTGSISPEQLEELLDRIESKGFYDMPPLTSGRSVGDGR